MEEFPLNLLTKTGEYTFVFVIFLVAANYWGVIQLNKIPFPYFVDLLYAYLIINGIAITRMVYKGKKMQVSLSKFCPNCDSPLEATYKYKCPKCGDIKIGDK